MLNLLVVIIGVALGTVLANVFMLVIMLAYPRIIKVFLERYFKVCTVIAEEFLNTDLDVKQH